jgi:hypothetical protein
MNDPAHVGLTHLLPRLTEPEHRRPLPDPVRDAMERLFGTDFGGVTVQLNPAAVAIGARAFAFGDEIHFMPGEYQPGTPEGWRVLAHELAHVVQQRSGRVVGGPRTETSIVADADLEREAEWAGELAAEMFRTGRVRRHPLVAGTPAGTNRAGRAIQCLMTFAEFKTATNITGTFRRKITPVDTALRDFHTLDAARPRNYTTLLAQLRTLYQACQTYLGTDGKRKAGVNALVRQIGLEEVVLTALDQYYREADPLRKWEFLETAQESCLQIEHRPDFTRRNCNQEILDLIAAYRIAHEMHKSSDVGVAVINRDIEALKAVSTRDSVPDVLRDVILEVTAVGNLRQLDMKVFTPGAAYNTANGSIQKYTLKHWTDQGRGKKFRLGSLLHELTHVSIAETFGNTVIMLSISPSASDDEMLNLARTRRANISRLKAMITNATGLDGGQKGELQDKANYPVSGKFQTYLTNFKKLLGVPTHTRLTGLMRRGLDCELIEYDTVVNQMMMWCYLWGLELSHPLYRELRVLAKVAYDQRLEHRRSHRRIVNPWGGPVQTRVQGRRMSF